MGNGRTSAPNADEVEAALRAISSEAAKADVARFFHDGLGETQVLGVGIGKVFPVAKAHKDLPLAEIEALLESVFYEMRMAAAAIMDFQARERKPVNSHAELYELYLRRHDRLDNWDLVDRAAIHVVGRFLEDKPRDPLYELARSPDPWRRRTAVVATAYYLRKGDPAELFAISEILAGDSHVMVQKAFSSWIRTAGDTHPERLRAFLAANRDRMSATALRIATEKMSDEEKARFRR
jgi:3-methyladenine DNA glycosylase AlkD